MVHTSRLGLILLATASWSPSGFAQDRSPQALPRWGQIIDPDRDCQFRLDGGRLTISVPATRHDLAAETGGLNAPRVLRDIEGDFIVQVKVSGNVVHNGDRTAKQNAPYHGAGLLLWQDQRNYLRLERAAIHREDGVVHYVHFELRKDGEPFNSPSAEISDQEFSLRAERRGGRECGAISPDGARWHYLNPLPVTFPPGIKLGVAAINTSTERFNPAFLELEVYKKEPDRGP
jgi:regulation of enolase protein 1 (concanavalin A-like superfamily)